MSRTYRRTDKQLIRKKLGHVSSLEPRYFFNYDNGQFVQQVMHLPRYESEHHFKRSVSRFKSDAHRRWRTAPRWWKMIMFIGPERRKAKMEIRRCLNQNSFDDHQDPHYRGANRLFWWMMT
ncbi:MAG TPA: hypothetical protein VN081_03115 [Dongiaceae bacterium]|nr:hypothetical protein [Dongiaceae bacterium]